MSDTDRQPQHDPHYIVNGDAGMIVDVCGSRPDPQPYADFCHCTVYVIEGREIERVEPVGCTIDRE